MSRARQLQSLFMTMQIKMLTKEDLVKNLREIFEVEPDEPDHTLVLVIKQACEVHEQAEVVNQELHNLSQAISSLRFKL
jgi:hypothetical protein